MAALCGIGLNGHGFVDALLGMISPRSALQSRHWIVVCGGAGGDSKQVGGRVDFKVIC